MTKKTKMKNFGEKYKQEFTDIEQILNNIKQGCIYGKGSQCRWYGSIETIMNKLKGKLDELEQMIRNDEPSRRETNLENLFKYLDSKNNDDDDFKKAN